MSYVKWEDMTYCDIEIFRINDGVPELFGDLWIAGLSVLRVVFTNHFGGGISPKCKVKVDKTTYTSSGDQINVTVRFSGEAQEVVCTADYGSFEVSQSTTIEVRRHYEEPKVIPAVKNATDIVCGRCMEDGTLSAQGELLYLNAMRSYSAVAAPDGSDQRNFCRMRLRWKTGSGDFGSWISLLGEEDLGSDEVKEVVPGVSLSRKNAHVIQVGVVDSTGAEHTITRRIPATADTPLHLGRGGKNIGLGGFCDYSHSEAIDVFWDAWFHRGLEVLGDVQMSGDMNVDGQLSVNGGIGIREVFRCENANDTGWVSGQTLGEAFPEADGALLDQGTVFLAVIRRAVRVTTGTAGITYAQTYNVLCVREGDRITGSAVGYYHYKPITGDVYSNIPFSLAISSADHTLEAYMGTDSPSAFTYDGTNGNSVRALYVLF